MVQILKPVPTSRTLRQQAFQEGLDRAMGGISNIYGQFQQQQQTKRQQALGNIEAAAKLRAQGYDVTPQQLESIAQQSQGGGISDIFSLSENEPVNYGDILSKRTPEFTQKQEEKKNKPKGGSPGKSGGSYAPPKKEEKFAQNQFQAAGYATRAEQAEKDLMKLPEDVGLSYKEQAQEALPGFAEGLKTPQQKLFEQAQRNFITAVLRKESGATISPEEYKNERKKYFPQSGDTKEVLEQKAISRRQAVASLKAEASGAYGKVQEQLQIPSASPSPMPEQNNELQELEMLRRKKAGAL